MKTYKIVKVQWRDPKTILGWTTLDQIRHEGAHGMFAAGIMVPAKKGHIGITNVFDPEGRVGDTAIIPRSAIEGKVEVLSTIKV